MTKHDKGTFNGVFFFVILPIMATTPTHAEKMIIKIEAILEGTADPSVRATEINGVRLERYPVADLLKLRSFYKSENALEAAAAANTGTTSAFGTPVTFFGRCMP